MDALIVMLKNVIVFVLLAVPGLVLVKTKTLKSEQSAILSKTLLYVGLPFLILDSMLDISFTTELLKLILVSAAIGLGFSLLCFALSAPFTKGEQDEKTRGIIRFCSIFANNGFLGIPLAKAVFPTQPLVLTGLVIIGVITNALMYTLGVYIISGDKSRMSLKKAFINPVLIAFALGLLLNLLGVKNAVPEISTYAKYLGNIVTPLCMIILGMKMGEVQFKPLFTSKKMYIVALFKLIIVPAFALALAYLSSVIFHLGADVVLAVFIAFGMPTATLSTTFADNFGGDWKNAVNYTLGTTVLSIVTIPIIYTVLLAIL